MVAKGKCVMVLVYGVGDVRVKDNIIIFLGYHTYGILVLAKDLRSS